jgi:hypothetical protein
MVDDAILLLERRLVFLVDDDEAEIAERQERNSAERAPTTTGARPSATLRQVRQRAVCPISECHAAGGAPKRCSNRASHCALIAISGSSTSTCLPRATAAAIASK